MEKIINLLIESKIFSGKLKWIIYVVGIAYLLLSFYLIIDNVFLGKTINIKDISSLYNNIGGMIFILFIVALMSKGKENIDLKKEEKLLLFIRDNEGKYKTRDELIDGYKKEYNEILHSPQINKLLTTTAKSKGGFGSIRDSLDKPFIEKNEKNEFILTDEGKKYIKENLT